MSKAERISVGYISHTFWRLLQLGGANGVPCREDWAALEGDEKDRTKYKCHHDSEERPVSTHPLPGGKPSQAHVETGDTELDECLYHIVN